MTETVPKEDLEALVEEWRESWPGEYPVQRCADELEEVLEG